MRIFTIMGMNRFGIIGLVVLIGMGMWLAEEVSAHGIQFPQGSGARVTGEEVVEILDLHNRARIKVGSRPLTWSKEIAAYAQEWVNHLVKTDCSLRHRPRSGEYAQKYGENGFMGTKGYDGIGEAVRLWQSEARDYEGQVITESNYTLFGHYTQMVWKASAQMGCGKAECDGRILFLCNYDPPGNVFGETPY